MLRGDCREVLAQLEPGTVDRIVTGPPFFGPTWWGTEKAIGSEPAVEGWLASMLEVFAQLRRVLKIAGTAWVLAGDDLRTDVIGQPWRLALALERAGWRLLREGVWCCGVGSVPGYQLLHVYGHPSLRWRFPKRLHLDGNCWRIPQRDTIRWPRELVERCMMGLPPGSVVLDPFAGGGIVGTVAATMGLESVLIECREEGNYRCPTSERGC